MNISFSNQDLAFRDEVRAFLTEAWTDDLMLNPRQHCPLCHRQL